MFWFYHEYLDEARRFRIHRIDSDTEQEARRLHRQACEFRWVTHHAEPTVSSLFTRAEYGPRTVVSGHRPGQPYTTTPNPVPPPADVLTAIHRYRHSNEPQYEAVGEVAQARPDLGEV